MPIPAFDEEDLHSAALCAWKEARGQGADGMLAVLCVLRNRPGKVGFPKSLHDVIYGKNQFTSMSVPSDPEFTLVPPDGDGSFQIATALAEQVFNGSPVPADITNGALYYANLHEIPKDGWFYKNIVLSPEHPVRAQIEKHTFFA